MPDSQDPESLLFRVYLDRHIMARLATDLRVSRQMGSRDYGALLQRMLRLLNQMTADEMANTSCILSGLSDSAILGQDGTN